MSESPRWWALLDDDERRHVRSLVVDDVRRTFLTSRAAQRLVLGRYLGGDVASVRIDRRCGLCDQPGHGRPRLVGEPGRPPVDFSVTHAAGHVLIAVVGSGQVGIDVEAHRPTIDTDALAGAVLTEAERSHYLSLSADDRRAWFFRAWVRKEAVAKVTGLGLSLGPETLDVGLQPSDVAVTIQSYPHPIVACDVEAPPGFSMALAVTMGVVRPGLTVHSIEN